MRFLHSLLLVVVLAVCYLLFFRSQPAGGANSPGGARTTQIGPADKSEDPVITAPVHSQYKADLDRAHAVANKMKASHDEVNSF